jgi:hypothetical protein
MNKRIIIALLIMGASLGVNAQKNKQDRTEKMQAYKISFIEEKLALTDQEKADFIPLYKEFLAKEQECRKDFRADHRGQMDKKEPLSSKSDAEITKELDAHIARKEKGLAIDKEYLAKFKAVLPIRKVAQLYEAERAFKKELLDKLRDGKSGQHRGEKRPMEDEPTN